MRKPELSTAFDWMAENAPNTFSAIFKVFFCGPQPLPDLGAPGPVSAPGTRRLCPRCQRPLNYLPGRGAEPDRWFCTQRLPYSNEFCGYEEIGG